MATDKLRGDMEAAERNMILSFVSHSLTIGTTLSGIGMMTRASQISSRKADFACHVITKTGPFWWKQDYHVTICNRGFVAHHITHLVMTSGQRIVEQLKGRFLQCAVRSAHDIGKTYNTTNGKEKH